MTRLIDDWIKDINEDIKEKEEELYFKTGLDYTSISSKGSGVSVEEINKLKSIIKVGIIPITSGMGIIGTFSESVRAIINCMGFTSFISERTDVTGIYEATEKGADIIFLADDEKFLALNLSKNIVAENSIATAKGFVAALEGAVGELNEKEVLVIGYGLVGSEMVKVLEGKNAKPVIYDNDKEILKILIEKKFSLINDISEIKNYEFILDASNSGEWINKDMLNPKVWIASPGVPLSLDVEAYQVYGSVLIHDYLPIGVATMMGMVCKNYFPMK